MGKPCRPARVRPLAYPNRLYNRRFGGSAPVEPAVYPGHRACLRLPQVQEHGPREVAGGTAGIVRDHLLRALRPCAGLHQAGAEIRAFLCQYLRNVVQLGRAHLRFHDACGARLDALRILQPSFARCADSFHYIERHAFRDALHRLGLVDRMASGGRHGSTWPYGASR